MDFKNLLLQLAKSGVTVLVKIDSERNDEKDEPWTVIMSSERLNGSAVRVESKDLDDCLEKAIKSLEERLGNTES